MGAVAPPRIVGAGQGEAGWRASAWLAALEERPAAELLRGRRRLVVVSPHPDDEVLACGGLMRAATCTGLEVWLVAVTDGEACYLEEAPWTAEHLREARPREVQRALATLGVRAQVQRLAIPDGGVEHSAAVLGQRLRTLVQPDDLVLAPWEHDGHPDHDAAGRAALAAVEPVGARLLRYPVWAWHWLEPGTNRPPFSAFRMPLESGALALKCRAIACFNTQLNPGGSPPPAPILPAHVVERFHRPFEVYLP